MRQDELEQHGSGLNQLLIVGIIKKQKTFFMRATLGAWRFYFRKNHKWTKLKHESS